MRLTWRRHWEWTCRRCRSGGGVGRSGEGSLRNKIGISSGFGVTLVGNGTGLAMELTTRHDA